MTLDFAVGGEVDTCGQRTGMTLTVDGTDVMDLDYTTTNGRLTEISQSGAGMPAGVFSYSYLPNSNLLESLTSRGGTGSVLISSISPTSALWAELTLKTAFFCHYFGWVDGSRYGVAG